jgi:hypothetical protein
MFIPTFAKEPKGVKIKFEEWSYNRQSAHFGDATEFPKKLYESWLNENTADYWRHIRSFEIVRLIAESRVGNKRVNWLTIGDGRLGLDSIRIRNLGFTEVLATDISPHLLEIAKKKN